MADVKISALPASTTPLAGTEVLPIVQSSTTKQVSVANLTAGRAVSAASLAATGPSGGLSFINIGSGISGDYCLIRGYGNPVAADGYTVCGLGAYSSLVSANTLVGSAEFAKQGSGTDNLTFFKITVNNNSSPIEALRVHATTGVSIGNTTDPGAGNLSVQNGFSIESSASLPASTGSSWLFSNESPVKRIYIGDGTAYSLALSKRTASTTTDVVTFIDSGNMSTIGSITSTSNTGLVVGSSVGYQKQFGRSQSSPYDQLVITSAGGAGGWQGAINLLLSYNAGATYTAMSIQDTGTGTAAGSLTTVYGGLTVNGLINPQQATTAAAPAYVKGAIYFDTTLNKLRVGGATAWETITSI